MCLGALLLGPSRNFILVFGFEPMQPAFFSSWSTDKRSNRRRRRILIPLPIVVERHRSWRRRKPSPCCWWSGHWFYLFFWNRFAKRFDLLQVYVRYIRPCGWMTMSFGRDSIKGLCQPEEISVAKVIKCTNRLLRLVSSIDDQDDREDDFYSCCLYLVTRLSSNSSMKLWLEMMALLTRHIRSFLSNSEAEIRQKNAMRRDQRYIRSVVTAKWLTGWMDAKSWERRCLYAEKKQKELLQANVELKSAYSSAVAKIRPLERYKEVSEEVLKTETTNAKYVCFLLY